MVAKPPVYIVAVSLFVIATIGASFVGFFWQAGNQLGGFYAIRFINTHLQQPAPEHHD